MRLGLSGLLAVAAWGFVASLSLQAHDGDHHHAPPAVPDSVTYKPTAVPDRIVLTWAADPATTQSVTWRTDASVTKAFIEYAEADDGPLFVEETERQEANSDPLESDIGVAHYHSATLTGLEPETKYVYRVGDGTNWSEWAHFSTASTEPKPFSFVYVGDAQNNIKAHWSRLIRQAYQDAPKASFVLHAGDLVNRGNRDGEWGEWFYAQGFIPRSTPCVAVPGNHEQSKTFNAETGEVTRRLTDHWEHVFEFPKNGPEGSREAVYFVDYQGVRIIGLDSTGDVVSQADWLRGVLEDNPQAWTVVTFHHPIYSSKAGRDNRELRKLLQPIFDEHRVDLVLNGHDHTYARTQLMRHKGEQNVPVGVRAQSDQGGTVYVVSVSGPKMYDLGRRPFMRRAAEDTQLYQVITVDGDELRYVARTAIGRPYDGFTLRKREGATNELIEQVPETPERTRPASERAEVAVKLRKTDQVPVAEPTLRLTNPQARDQDDLCVWRNHQTPEESLFITSDKAANRLFVYDLEGQLLQSVEVPMPGNIDARYDVSLGGGRVDVVAVNQREQGTKLRVFRVNAKTRSLEAIDGGGIATGPNYGGCLYRSPKDGALYFFTTSKADGCEQIALRDNGQGQLVGEIVRRFEIGKSEGAVADDRAGQVYVAAENEGIWRFDAEPDGATEGTMILSIGDSGLQGDLEGVALTVGDNQIRYLTVSDQGTSTFHVLPLIGGRETYRFAIEGARDSDGIEVASESFGKWFPEGFFACHSDDPEACPILITPLPRVLAAIGAN